jgi:phosphatidylserine decarboxylase
MFSNNKLLQESPYIFYTLVFGILICLVVKYMHDARTNYPLLLLTITLIIMLYFYRDPNTHTENFGDNIVVAPSYGKVVKIDRNEEKNIIHICIFLSPIDVHQQYYPINGTIIKRKYDRTGKFNIAIDLDKSRFNEKKIHVLENKYGKFVVTQIAGKLVRCIVSDEDIDVRVSAGTRFGMIKFGSRVDIEIPNAKKFKLLVNENEYLIGGYQKIGFYD